MNTVLITSQAILAGIAVYDHRKQIKNGLNIVSEYTTDKLETMKKHTSSVFKSTTHKLNNIYEDTLFEIKYRIGKWF